MNMTVLEMQKITELIALLSPQQGTRPGASGEPVKKFLRLPAVIAATGKSRSNTLRAVKVKTFPAPVHIGPRAIAWDSDDLATWQQERIDARQT